MKGKVGTPCKDEFLRKTDNIKTTKEIRANKTKILKEIKIILNSKSNYNYIAKELEMHTIDVLQLLQEETLQFGTNISKAMTKHLMDRGVTVSEIAELYNCDEVKVLLTLNEINDNDYRNKIKEIFDVSIVTNPAYESTSCTSYKRAKEQLNNQINSDDELELIKIELELDEI